MVLKRKLMALLMTVMLLVMSAAPALAHHQVGHANAGHQADDGLDNNQGGGNDHIKTNHRGGNKDY